MNKDDPNEFFDYVMESLKKFSNDALLFLLLCIRLESDRRKDESGGGCYVETREGFPQ